MGLVSALLGKFSGAGKGDDAIRRSTTETMAYLLERNRKFEIFLEEKLVALEKKITPKTGASEDIPDDFFDDDYDGMGEDTLQQIAGDEAYAGEDDDGLFATKEFGDLDVDDDVDVDDKNEESAGETDEAGEDNNAAAKPGETAAKSGEGETQSQTDNWQDVYGVPVDELDAQSQRVLSEDDDAAGENEGEEPAQDDAEAAPEDEEGADTDDKSQADDEYLDEYFLEFLGDGASAGAPDDEIFGFSAE